jgi:uncharacterized protein involved in exopolysaccharide biosynthesis
MTVDQYSQSSGSPQGSSQDDEEGGGLDLEQIKGYVNFVFGSIGRRKILFLTTLIGGICLAYTVYWLMPRTYHVEIQLLAQKNSAIIELAGSGDQGSPVRAAAETVLRRDNLIALVQKADMIADWDHSRSHAAEIKDWIRAKLGRFTSDQDKMDMIIGTLEDKLTVAVKSDNSGEGTVTIAVDWSDARMAYRLVTAAHQSFLEARHLAETTAISEALSILIARANSLGREIESTAKAIQDQRQQLAAGKRHRVAIDPDRRPTRPALADTAASAAAAGDKEAAIAIQAQWEQKRAAVRDLEDMRRKRIAELQTHLDELRATYADSHPAIVDAQQTIETLSQDSPQLAQLKKDEATLHSQYLSLTARAPESAGEALASHLLRGTSSIRETAEPDAADDPATEFAKAQLRVRAATYDSLLGRIEGAHMQMETARAAFKYRYTVLRPASMPRMPEKPKSKTIVGGGSAAALLLAILAAVGMDLRSGRVFAAWQLERALRLPVLAELRHDQ